MSAEEAPASPITVDLGAWVDDALRRGDGTRLGHGYQGAVLRLQTPVGDLVVKTPHDSLLLGALGRRALRREAEIYRRLTGVPGVPKSHGLLHGRLLLEHVPGPSLRVLENRLEDRERFFAALLATLQAMHARGVAHGDLKRKDNVLVGPDEQPYVIDFGVAVSADRGSRLWRRKLYEIVRQTDYNAWIKLKYMRRYDAIAPQDARWYRPLLLERAARAIRVPWQKITLRRLRRRRRG